jgi:hypothetical protein
MENTESNVFERTLRDIGAGSSAGELSQELRNLVGKVRATGKGGELTYRIKIKPASGGIVSAVMVQDKITLKLPELERPTTIMFTTDDNTLQRTDPRQKEMELKVVKEQPAELRKVG